jgi:glutamate dehydrogenase/leucine dehydrogenase
VLFSRSGPGAGYERLVVVQRPRVGLRAIIAVSSTRRGPAFGGIRRLCYASEAQALEDALALAEAMSHKCALAGLPAGGAKTVVLRPAMDAEPQPDWDAAYEALGAEIAALRGAYVCGPDLGTGDVELAAVRRSCGFVNPPGNDAGLSTAAGVHAGLRAVWRVLERPASEPRTVAIQGLGAVGRALATMLRSEGVELVGADIDAAACRAAAALGVRIVEPAAVLAQACDVLVPCAGGRVLDAAAIAGLRCRAVCGSANNQLATPEDALRLHARGIVHAPDVVVSAGAVIEGVLTVQAGGDASVRARVREAIAAIEGTLGAVLDEAARRGRPPTEVARARAEQGLEA